MAANLQNVFATLQTYFPLGYCESPASSLGESTNPSPHLTPAQTLTPEHLVIRENPYSLERLQRLFNPYGSLQAELLSTHNLVSDNRTTKNLDMVSLSNHQIPQVQAYLGLMFFVSRDDTTLPGRLSMLEGIVRSLDSPVQTPTEEILLEYVNRSFPNLKPAVLERLALRLFEACQKHGAALDPNGAPPPEIEDEVFTTAIEKLLLDNNSQGAANLRNAQNTIEHSIVQRAHSALREAHEAARSLQELKEKAAAATLRDLEKDLRAAQAAAERDNTARIESDERLQKVRQTISHLENKIKDLEAQLGPTREDPTELHQTITTLEAALKTAQAERDEAVRERNEIRPIALMKASFQMERTDLANRLAEAEEKLARAKEAEEDRTEIQTALNRFIEENCAELTRLDHELRRMTSQYEAAIQNPSINAFPPPLPERFSMKDFVRDLSEFTKQHSYTERTELLNRLRETTAYWQTLMTPIDHDSTRKILRLRAKDSISTLLKLLREKDQILAYIKRIAETNQKIRDTQTKIRRVLHLTEEDFPLDTKEETQRLLRIAADDDSSAMKEIRSLQTLLEAKTRLHVKPTLKIDDDIQEAKNQLSHYLSQLGSSERFELTPHGLITLKTTLSADEASILQTEYEQNQLIKVNSTIGVIRGLFATLTSILNRELAELDELAE